MNSQNTQNQKENKQITHRSATDEEIEILKKEGMVAPGMICPKEFEDGRKCGLPIDYIRVDDIEYTDKDGNKKKHMYYYAGHKPSKGSRKNVVYHYLGSLAYDYVERFNKLGLQGLVNSKRENEYLEKLLNKMNTEGKFTANDLEKMLNIMLFNLDKIAIDDNEKKIMLEKIKKIQEKLEEKK